MPDELFMARPVYSSDGLGDISSISSVVGGAKSSNVRAAKLERGRWHIMRVLDADHSLGTWASDRSDEMYQMLFELLDTRVDAVPKSSAR